MDQDYLCEERALLDPRTKMLLVLTIATICVAGGSSPLTSLAKVLLAAVPFLLYVYERRWKTAVIYAVAYTVAILGGSFLLGRTYGVVNFILVALFMVVARFMPGLAMGSYLVTSTRVSEFMAAMQRMHIPRSVSISLSVTFRFFPSARSPPCR